MKVTVIAQIKDTQQAPPFIRPHENPAPLDVLKPCDPYKIAENLYNRVRPSDAETRYIRRLIKSQHMNPHALLLRGWWIDFTAITRAPGQQLNIFTNI